MNCNIMYRSYTQYEFDQSIKGLINCKVGVNKKDGNFMSSEYAIVYYIYKAFKIKVPDNILVCTNKEHTFIIMYVHQKRSSGNVYPLIANIQVTADVASCTDDYIHYIMKQQSLSRSIIMEPKLKDYIKLDGLNITVINPTPAPKEKYTIALESGGPVRIWKSSDCLCEGDFEGDYVDCLEYLYDNRDDKELCHQYALVKDQLTKSMQVLEYSKSIKIDKSKFTIVCIGSINEINKKLKEISYKYTDNIYHVWTKDSIAYQISSKPNPTAEFNGSLEECNSFIYDKIKSRPSNWKYAIYNAPGGLPYIGVYNSGDDEFHGSLRECNEYVIKWYMSNINKVKKLING